jgi:AcrR family transcriptional regulator
VKERRERIKQATRQGILDASRHIARQEGWSALTIRKVADAIEYSPSIVYEYFASKEEILITLLQEGFGILTSQMEAAQHSTDDPNEQALLLCDAYWQFAHDHPDLYEVMHGLAGVRVDPALRAESVQAICTLTEGAIIAWAKHNQVTLPIPSYEAMEIVWGLLHGMVSLALIDRLDSERSRGLLHHAVITLLQGWRSTTV